MHKLIELIKHTMKVKKLSLGLSVVLYSFQALASWNFVMDSSTVTGYIDPATIQASGSSARAWVLYDYKSPQVISNKINNSFKALYEFDCKGGRSKTLSTVFYSGNMGGGEVNHLEQKPSDWAYITPDTVNASLSKVACGRK